MNVQGGDQSVHTSWTNTPIMIWMSCAFFNSVCVEIVRAGRIDNGFRPADLGTRHAGPLLCERRPCIPPLLVLFPGSTGRGGPVRRAHRIAYGRTHRAGASDVDRRPTDAQWHEQHFLCCPAVRVWSFSLWVGRGHTDGLDSRAARTNRTPLGTPVDDNMEASTSRARRGVGSAPDQPSSTTQPAILYDWYRLRSVGPAGRPDGRATHGFGTELRHTGTHCIIPTTSCGRRRASLPARGSKLPDLPPHNLSR